MTLGQRFARLVTNVVSRLPWLWVLFRRPLARMFDRMAPTWDTTRVTPQHLAPLESALELVGVAPQRILDIGTGTGGAARALAARWPEAGVTGVDFSPEMIREAQARATSVRERYVAADATALPFADEAFDLVTLLNMIPFYDELARVTAPGGTVVLAFSRGEQTPIWVPFDRSRSELRRRGFGSFREVAAGSGKSLLAVRGDPS
jgi:ubiquinone/menaquinone biosynthesis C-methylase UbiE